VTVTEDQGGLFEVPELAGPPRARRNEEAVHAALAAGIRDKLVRDVDGGLAATALSLARALDRAEALPDKSAVYAVAQVAPQLQKALHGLGLPLEAAPVGGARLPDAGQEAGGAPSWLGELGTPR